MPEIKFEGSFKVTHLMAGSHTFFIPLNDEVAKLLGQIVVYWGAFEHRMDVVTETVLTGMKLEQPNKWKLLSFRKRKTLFRDTMRAYTASHFPHMRAAFDQIVTKSGDLHWRRNIVAHGYFSIEPIGEPDDSGAYEGRYIAHGTVKGTRRTIPIDTETLERLWHDIAHLVGELMVAINAMGGTVEGNDLVLPDTDFLQDDESDSFRLLATRPQG